MFSPWIFHIDPVDLKPKPCCSRFLFVFFSPSCLLLLRWFLIILIWWILYWYDLFTLVLFVCLLSCSCAENEIIAVEKIDGFSFFNIKKIFRSIYMYGTATNAIISKFPSGSLAAIHFLYPRAQTFAAIAYHHRRRPGDLQKVPAPLHRQNQLN